MGTAPLTLNKQSNFITIDENDFTPQELSTAKSLVPNIDIMDYQLVATYGYASQKKLSLSSEDILKQMRMKDMESVKRDIEDLISIISKLKTEAMSFLDHSIGLFSKRSSERLIIEYSIAENEIEKIIKRLEEHQLFIMQDLNTLRRFKKANTRCYKELSLYIWAGQEKLNQLSQLPNQSNDLKSAIERFKRKLSELALSRNVALQTSAQIELILNNDQEILERISTIINSTLPLWKNQIVLALGIDDLSDSFLTQSKKRKVDISALINTNQKIEDILSSTRAIQMDSGKKRSIAEYDLKLLNEQ